MMETSRENILSTPSSPIDPKIRRQKWVRRFFKLGVYTFFTLYALITLFPFYMLFVRSFVGTADSAELHLWIPEGRKFSENARIGDVTSYTGVSMSKFKEDMGIPPTEFVMSNASITTLAEKYDIPAKDIQEYFEDYSVVGGWYKILQGGEFVPAMLRSVVVTLISLFFINLLSMLTGYGLAGLRRRDQIFVYNLYLLQMVIPPMLIILPQFFLVTSIWEHIPGYEESRSTSRLIAQLSILILINVRGTALSTMIYTSYISTIPRELEEATLIDGGSRWQYFIYVLVPLMRIPAASLTVIVLPIYWNDFLQPFIYTDKRNTTILPLVQSFAGEFYTDFQASFAAIFLSLVPLVVIYIIFRRWFVRGVMAGAIKG